jgi:hypothetical protein
MFSTTLTRHYNNLTKNNFLTAIFFCCPPPNVPVLCFCIWSDDGSIETKHVAEFLILITDICCVID